MRLFFSDKRIDNPFAVGMIGVIHRNRDETTPRGPSMDIRPGPEQIIEWTKEAGFAVVKQIDLPTYHYGSALKKQEV